MARRSIAYCGCGNVSVDGLNFKRVENAGIPTLQCAGCGATSSDFEYLNRAEVEPLVEAVRETLCDEAGCTRCAPFRAALKPFGTPNDRGEGGE